MSSSTGDYRTVYEKKTSRVYKPVAGAAAGPSSRWLVGEERVAQRNLLSNTEKLTMTRVLDGGAHVASLTRTRVNGSEELAPQETLRSSRYTSLGEFEAAFAVAAQQHQLLGAGRQQQRQLQQ